MLPRVCLTVYAVQNNEWMVDEDRFHTLPEIVQILNVSSMKLFIQAYQDTLRDTMWSSS